MSTLTELDKVLSMLYDINDTVRSNCGDEAYYALRDAIESVRNAWNVCKRGQEAKLENAYRDPVQSSRKPIKSFRDTSNEDTSNDYGFHWDGDNIYDKDGYHWYFGDYTKGNTGIEPYSSYMQAVKETEDSIRDSFTEDEIPDPEDYAYQLIDFAVETLPDPGKFIKEYEGFVKSSRRTIKSDYHDKEIYRQAFGSLLEDYAPEGDFPGGYRVLVDGNYETEFSANSREEAIQKFKDYFANKRESINNSKKPIKSSLEDRLVPYLEEFEEGYANAITRDSEDANEFNHVYEDTFFEQFKSDYNLTDTDIQKLDRAVREIWDASSTEEGEVRDMGEMYGAPRGATPEEALKHFE